MPPSAASELVDRRSSALDARRPSVLSARVDHEKRDGGSGLGDGSAESSNRSDLSDLDPGAAPVAIVDHEKREGGSTGRTTCREDCDHEKRDRNSPAARRASTPNGTLPSVSNEGRIGSSDGDGSSSSGGPNSDDLTLTAGEGGDGFATRRTMRSSLLVDTDRPEPSVSGGVDDASVIVLSGRKTRYIGGRPGEPGLGGGGGSMDGSRRNGIVGDDGCGDRSKYEPVGAGVPHVLGDDWLSGDELDEPIVHGAICVRSPSFVAVRVRVRFRCRPLGDGGPSTSICVLIDWSIIRPICGIGLGGPRSVMPVMNVMP